MDGKKLESVKKPIKILFVSHEYHIGGSSVSLNSMIQGINQKYGNHVDITVVLPYVKNNAAKKLFEMRSIKTKSFFFRNSIKKIGEKKTKMDAFHDFCNSLAVFHIALYILFNHYDIVCSNSTGTDVGARAAAIAHVPHVFYVREFMEEDHSMEYRNKKRMEHLINRSDFVIFISKAIEKKYIEKYKINHYVQFYNGFITKDYYTSDHKILNTSEISFVQIGTLTEGKGTSNTIDLLYQLYKSGVTQWNMEFLGEGEMNYVESLKNKIVKYNLQSKIKISPFSNNVGSILSSKDILIMNSHSEGFGRVTVEGMLAGCLVIGRYSAGTKEVLIPNENGLVYQTADEFVNVVQKVFDNREEYVQLAKKGQNFAMKTFDINITARNFMGVIEKCITK